MPDGSSHLNWIKWFTTLGGPHIVGSGKPIYLSVSDPKFTELYCYELCIGTCRHLQCLQLCNMNPCWFLIGPANDCDLFHLCMALPKQHEPFFAWLVGLRSPRPVDSSSSSIHAYATQADWPWSWCVTRFIGLILFKYWQKSVSSTAMLILSFCHSARLLVIPFFSSLNP